MSLLKSASLVSLLTLASRITGLVRELLMASAFGASALTDAFNVAFRIPNLLRRLFAEGAFSQAFVPVLAGMRATDGDDATRTLVNQIGTVLAWALTMTCVIGVAGAPLLVWAMASGLQQNPQGFESAVFMTRWMFPYIGFMSMVALSAGILNTWRHFAVPAATPVLLNLCMISAAYWGAPWFKSMGIEPIYAMAGGVMLGGALQLGVQIPALLSIGMLPRISWRWSSLMTAWNHPGTRRVTTLMLPAVLGVSVAQISLLINTQIASHLVSGSVSWLTYADRLMEFPTAMLGVALGVVLLPQLAAARAADDGVRYSQLLDWGLRLVVLLAVPSAVALLTFAQPLVTVMYHYGAFSEADVNQTSVALMGYGAGLLGLVAIKVLAPGFYARQDIRTPVKIAIVVLVLTQCLNLLFVPRLAHAGLALAIGIGAMVNALWLLVGLIRRGAYTPSPGWWRFALQVLAASALMAVALLWAASAINWIHYEGGRWLRVLWLAGSVIGAAAIYFGVLAVSGVKLRQLLKR
ncbi:murein biosynthesis integral membrane protein MurJ [Hydrogenophaga sp. PAMC20947]|uniref:murein biosynthesis integral membrane protein MurJ n=1 Tax=Hydrogenophaga sp. PAMC20947 TaxID=2565558 RepID=UPI00109E0970|nr:murein biosynthesis integral membrane protein MurJ [Hydrogenophaga sp. PAMC20947]QCB44777.1 murein biosynthesis integral membrane protein MurJ [Hydrogenophaga sp. PAMC20947]